MMRSLIIAATLFLLTACGSDYSPYGGSKDPVGVKLGKPYTVMGQYYEPKYDPDYEEIGVASWYGPGFHGRMTASGEEFDTAEMTCAHRTLPMPALVRVENLDNGKSAIVRVNDRGPFSKSRIVDLSEAAAERLGVKAKGTAHVRVRYLEEETEEYIASRGLEKPQWMQKNNIPAPKTQMAALNMPSKVTLNETSESSPRMEVVMTTPPPANISPKYPTQSPAPQFDVTYTPAVSVSDPAFLIQTASFTDRERAESHVGKLQAVGQALIKEVMINGQRFFRVLIGPVSSSQQAQQMLERTRALGFTDARILVN
ncbi:MAG: septal ring lytic transglycosylase RlpA family protein [Rickettsiales bacterium]|nr:septal ring lytic transglycosylase RlpA family protein [Rickettsiales bacterium]